MKTSKSRTINEACSSWIFPPFYLHYIVLQEKDLGMCWSRRSSAIFWKEAKEKRRKGKQIWLWQRKFEENFSKCNKEGWGTSCRKGWGASCKENWRAEKGCSTGSQKQQSAASYPYGYWIEGIGHEGSAAQKRTKRTRTGYKRPEKGFEKSPHQRYAWRITAKGIWDCSSAK